MTLGWAGNKTRRVKVHDDAGAQLSADPRPIRARSASSPSPDWATTSPPC